MESSRLIKTTRGNTVEEQFRIMADAAPVLIWLADTDKSSYYFNKKWLQFTGRTSEEESGGGWADDLHPEDFNTCLDIYISAFERRQEFKMEHRLRRFDGEYRWFIHNGVPRYNHDGIFEGYVCSCSDIHEIKELEKRKDEFISAASHELKTPVTTMKVYLHIIEEYFKEIGNEKHLKFASKAGDQVNKLSKIIKDLLDLSKIQAGSLEFEFSMISYCELVKEIIENFQSVTTTHVIELKGTCNAQIEGDTEKLSQALINLLNNAVKYSSEGNRIVIELSESGRFVNTSVKDFGIGIAHKHHEKIFDRFYRVHDKQKQTYPGLGIGLYIASEIIKRHGGKIWVESEEKKETNFTFALPIYEK